MTFQNYTIFKQNSQECHLTNYPQKLLIFSIVRNITLHSSVTEKKIVSSATHQSFKFDLHFNITIYKIFYFLIISKQKKNSIACMILLYLIKNLQNNIIHSYKAKNSWARKFEQPQQWPIARSHSSSAPRAAEPHPSSNHILRWAIFHNLREKDHDFLKRNTIFKEILMKTIGWRYNFMFR